MNKSFLLLLVIVYLLYNCKPLIEPFDNYDTSQDEITGYEVPPEQNNLGIFDQIYQTALDASGYNETPGDPNDPNDPDDSGICETYKNETCEDYAKRGGLWDYNVGGGDEWRPVKSSDTNSKNLCASCKSCQDGNRYVDSYYGWYCDALKADCHGGDPNSMIPFHYTYHSVNWNGKCGDTNNAQQKFTCNALNNPAINSFKLFTKSTSAECALEVSAKEAEQWAKEMARHKVDQAQSFVSHGLRDGLRAIR